MSSSSSSDHQRLQQFHRQKCQDTLQLIATIVDSSTPTFFPPNENATRLAAASSSVHGTTAINGTQYNFEQKKNELISTDFNGNHQGKSNILSKNLDSSRHVVNGSKLLSGYEEKVLDPFRLVNALKDQQRRRVL